MKTKLLLVFTLFVYAALLPQARAQNVLPCFSNTNYSSTQLGLPGLTTILSADFNGDSYADLATADNGGDDVWVLMGDGKGSFSASETLTFSNSITTIVSADFDNNGRPDLAAISGAGDVYIALWNGSVSAFSFKTMPALTQFGGDYPLFICSGDFNNDGKADLATANYSSLSVFTGKGGGAFSAPTPLSLISPSAICSGDFNDDNYADLAVIDGASNIAVFLWSASSKFSASPITVTLPGATMQGITDIIAQDFNADGYADLAAINTTSNNVYVELWDTTTTNSFSNSKGSPYATGQTQTLPYNICSADFNKDGAADLAVVNDNSYVSVFPGNKSGVFGSPLSFGLNTRDLDAQGICSADFNGDGLPDLAVVGNGGTYPLSVLLNVDKFTISGLDSAYCSSDVLNDTITTNINGVTASGFGIGGNIFNPNAAFQQHPDLGRYPITFTYNNGCTIDSSIEVTIYAQPSAPTAYSPVNYCQGNTATALTATADAGGTLNWYGTNATGGAATATPPTPLTDNTTTASYYVSQTVNGCEGPRADVIVNTVAYPPRPVIKASGPTTFCPGGSVTLSVSNPTASMYVWLPNGHVDTSYTVSVSYNYTVYGVNHPGGCESQTSAPVTVKVDSILVRIDSLDKEYCVSSDTVSIHGFPSGGIYTKSLGILTQPSDTLFIPSNARSSNDSVTTIVYKYTDALGCSNSDTVIVTIYSAATVSLTKKLWCYATDTVAIPAKVHPTGGTLTFKGTGIINNMFTPSNPGKDSITYKYTYAISDSSHCNLASTPAILLVDKPNVRFVTGLDSAYCLNSPNATVQVSPSQGSFSFSDSSLFYNLGNGKLLVRPSLAKPMTIDSLSYIYTDSNGCTAKIKDSTVVNPFPARPIATASQDSICSGDSLSLFASGAESGLNYNWTGPLFASIKQNPVIKSIDSTMSGQFIVYAKNSYNCYSSSDSVKVFVKPSPPTPLLYIPLTTICNYNYDSAYIKVLSDTADYSHYNWYLNNGLISGEHQPFLWVPEGGYYTLEVSHSLNNCVTYVDTTLRQTASPTPVVVGLNAPIDSALLCNTGQAVPLNYQWYVNEKTIIGEESKELTVYYNGVYSVFALYSENCGEFSATYTVNRYDFSSIARVATQTDSTIIIAPPASGISILRNGAGANYIVEYTSASNDAITITVTTITGVTLLQKEVSTKANARSETQINLDGLASAMYILNAATSTQSQYIKIIVN